MRGSEEARGGEMDRLTRRAIKEIWMRLDSLCAEKHTSIGAIAQAKGISASAVYRALRTVESGGYIDTVVNQIEALADGLDVPLSYILTGEKPNAMTIDVVVERLKLLPPGAQMQAVAVAVGLAKKRPA